MPEPSKSLMGLQSYVRDKDREIQNAVTHLEQLRFEREMAANLIRAARQRIIDDGQRIPTWLHVS
jgi:hypothetical protein